MPRFGAPWNPGWENPPKTLTLCLVGPCAGESPAGARPERDTAVAEQGLCRRGKKLLLTIKQKTFLV